MNYAGERRIDVAQSLGYKDGSTVIKILKHLKARIAEDASIGAYAESFDRMARGHVKRQALTPMTDDDPCHASSIANAALFGGLGQMGSSFISVRGMSTLKQAGYFWPKTVSGLLRTENARSLMNSYGTASGMGAASYFGGPF